MWFACLPACGEEWSTRAPALSQHEPACTVALTIELIAG